MNKSKLTRASKVAGLAVGATDAFFLAKTASCYHTAAESIMGLVAGMGLVSAGAWIARRMTPIRWPSTSRNKF